jgi:hypothetical protein
MRQTVPIRSISGREAPGQRLVERLAEAFHFNGNLQGAICRIIHECILLVKKGKINREIYERKGTRKDRSSGSTPELICRTTTAFSLRKPPILFEGPTAREPRVFADADGHDLARC